ncbi:MAG: polysaccharide pyruvyl transferase family protein [Verrucomicrobiota bacterium]
MSLTAQKPVGGLAVDKCPLPRVPHLLVRSSWQTVNIGDISHTPGLLRLLETHLPAARITLLARNLGHGVSAVLRHHFPRVEIIEEPETPDGLPATAAGQHAWAAADMFIHGSGPYVVARAELSAWAATGRPYGIYGVSLEEFDPDLIALLSGADFVFCRDTTTLRAVRAAGVRMNPSSCLGFAPDAAFAATDADERAADAFLAAHRLEPGKFICVVPRLRYTPYHRIHDRPPTPREMERAEISETYRERDHDTLRTIVSRWVRDTGLKVLACPEMTYQVDLARTELVEPLAPAIRSHVVWRDTYWRNDEAAGIYARAFAVVSVEMHSPILAFAAGTPAIHLRQPSDTVKGQMWRDIGLPEWIFEIDDTDGHDIADLLLQMHHHPDRIAAKLSSARAHVARLQAQSMEIVRHYCEAFSSAAR